MFNYISDFIKKIITLAITKGLIIFIIGVAVAQELKWDLTEFKYGNPMDLIVWALLAAPIVIYEVIKAKRNG